MNIYRVKNDVNGNPRRVIHFLAFLEGEECRGNLTEMYERALKKARRFGGRKFHNRQFGGGIVFQAYSDEDVLELVELVKKGVKR